MKTTIGKSTLVHSDCFVWLAGQPEASVHAVITDPPYGVKEFEHEQLEKKKDGKGGVWRIPPSFDGANRAALPRFTALNPQERKKLEEFFSEWATLIFRVLKPGGHVMVASNAFLSNAVFNSISTSGLEFRSEIIRLVRTLRGGDRPKNAEVEFPDVCSMPRGCYEPWGLFRKPLDKGMTVADCLRLHGTGGLRRNPSGGPFLDVLECERTPKREKEIAGHPSLKPQSLMRRLAWAALPTGRGLVLDPFMGSGSTLAACEALGLDSIGVERSPEFYEIAVNSVAKLARVEISSPSGESMLAEIEAEPFIGETLFTVDKSSSTSASQTPSA